jgi:outer membrane biosynthesis protein TonB
MNRSTFALFVALLIHLLLFLLLWIFTTHMPKQEEQKPQEERMKVSLKEYMPKKKEAESLPQKQEPSPIAPPMPKGKQLQELTKQEVVRYKPKEQPTEPRLNTPPMPKVEEQVQKPIVELLPPKEKHLLFTPDKEENLTKETKPKPKEASNPLYAMLSQDRSAQEAKEEAKQTRRGSNINQNIKELYGDEFGKLTKGQQQYILDNQEVMRRITQEVLNRVASVNIKVDLNVNRTNVIEFYLHPNGDMSDFKFLKQSGYYVLDETTKETIEYAYSRYPRPKEKILIRYNVFYNLARY